jgi:hypothetical protein
MQLGRCSSRRVVLCMVELLCLSDGNCVEQLQIMDNAKLATALMKDSEPAGLVGQV